MQCSDAKSLQASNLLINLLKCILGSEFQIHFGYWMPRTEYNGNEGMAQWLIHALTVDQWFWNFLALGPTFKKKCPLYQPLKHLCL